MKQLVVGVDGSSEAEGALRWAIDVAKPLHADLVAVSAWTPQQAELPPEEWQAEHLSRSESLQATIGAAPSDSEIRAEVVDGAPTDVLLDQSELQQADLLVVGIRGTGQTAGLRVGSVTETIGRRASRPFVVVPNVSSRRMRRILLGVDASPGARAAASWCAGFASALDVEVTAVSVSCQTFALVPEQHSMRVRQYLQRALDDDWIAPLRNAGVSVDTELLDDAAARMMSRLQRSHYVAASLVNAATRADAQMIVVGARRLAPPTRRRLGGVAMRLLHTTPIPLAVVPSDN